MNKEKISAYIEAHRQELINDVSALCRINSEKMPPQAGEPYGHGVAHCLNTALEMAQHYGFPVTNHEGYVGCVDFGENLPQCLDILAHLDIVPAGEGWEVTQAFSPWKRTAGSMAGELLMIKAPPWRRCTPCGL